MIPTPFYELLPYVYVLVGTLATIGIETTLGKICGMLLITSGIFIYKARSSYRNSQYQLWKAASRKSRGYSHRQLEVSRRNTTEPAGQARLPLQGSMRPPVEATRCSGAEFTPTGGYPRYRARGVGTVRPDRPDRSTDA